MAKDSTLVKTLRDQIEARHREALRAVDLLQRYLDECHVPDAQDVERETSETTTCRADGSFRQRVLAVMDDTWRNVEAIAELAGVEPKQARGVLYAKSVFESLESRRINGSAHFRLLEEPPM